VIELFKKRDPVCGMKVSKDSKYLLKYDNRIYYFDSQACKATFEKEPHRFIKRKFEKNFLRWLSQETTEVPKSCHDIKGDL
jgi:YHS domain-containing protein